VLTRLARDGDKLQRVDARVLPGTGLLQMQERWARRVAAEFIQQTRFDPLHSAATEQQLYDQLPRWLDILAGQADVNADLQNAGNTYHAKLRVADMLDAVRPLYLQLAEALSGASAALLLSPRVARLPRIGQFVGAATALDEDAVTRACLQHAAIIRCDDQDLRFVTRLPAPAVKHVAIEAVSAAPAPAPDAAAAAAVPSHLSLGPRAWRLEPGNLYLHRDALGALQLSRRAAANTLFELAWDSRAWWITAANGTRVRIDGKDLQRTTRVDAGVLVSLPDQGDAALHLIAEESVAGDGA
jgi:hypothetical protein